MRLLTFTVVLLSACTQPGVGVFVTQSGNPNGGDWGGLAGADAECTARAAAAGLPDHTWRAYLSTVEGPVHARDRIGVGPWLNAEGVEVASSVEDLHSGPSSVAFLDEFGQPAANGGPPGREHDILTGSTVDGMVDPRGRTCADWTSQSPNDSAVVGHHDWEVFINSDWLESWNQVHAAPCDRPGMERQLGSGRLYCFAVFE